MSFYEPYNTHIREEERERIRMTIVNHCRTSNMELLYDRLKEYEEHTGGHGHKNYNINKITFFKDIPDSIEILIDYINVTSLRYMRIPSEVVYESIYRELPELFEE